MQIEQKLPHLVNILLVLAIAFVLAQFITHRLTGGTTPVRINNAPASEVSVQRNTPLFSPANLFGKAKPKVAEKTKETPKKRVIAKLDMELLGVVAASAKGYRPTAIIKHKNETNAYVVGDKITDGVELLEVHAKSVVVSHGGVEKIIAMQEDEENTVFNTQNPVGTMPGEHPGQQSVQSNFSPKLTKRLKSYKEKLQKNPMSLIHLFVGEPVIRDGEMLGVRVRPGQDRELFKALQLQPKDIIMSINDIPITDTSRMNELMNLVGATNIFNLSIERNNAPVDLTVSLP